MLVFFKKLIYRRSPIFWMIFLTMSLLVATLCYFLFAQGLQLYRDIMPRLWTSVGSDRYLYLDTTKLAPHLVQKINEKIPGISVYQIEPSLALIGLAIEIDSDQPQRFKLKVFSDTAHEIKEDSIFSIQYQAPSTNQFIDYVLHSKEGKALIEEGKNNAKRIYHQSQDLYERILEQIKENVSVEDLKKLQQDMILKKLIQEVFQHEISDKINLSDLGNKIVDSSDFSHIMSLASSQISMGRILKTTKHEMGKQLGILKEESIPKNTEEWLHASKKIMLYYFQCQMLGYCMSPLLQDLNLQARGAEVGKEVGKDVVIQAINGLKENADQSLNASQNIAKMALQETQIISKSQAFISHLFQHPTIKAHISQHYGSPMLYQLENAFSTVWHQPHTQSIVNDAAVSSKDMIQRFLLLMVLDKNKSGPNPLLLAMIKEKLQKQYEFNINIQNQVDSSAKSVPNGYIFKLEGNLQ